MDVEERVEPDSLSEPVAASNAVDCVREAADTRQATAQLKRKFQARIDELTAATSVLEEKIRGLERIEERFQSLVQATGQIIWTNNATGSMEGLQPGWAGYTGQSFTDYQGFGWSKAIHPDDVARTLASWNQAVDARRLCEMEHRVRRHDGQYRHFWVRAVPVIEADGQIREWVGIHNDITERKREQEQVAAGEARYRSLLYQSPLAVHVLDPNGFTRAVNPAFERLFGITAQSLQGLNIFDDSRPQTPGTREILERTFAGESTKAAGARYDAAALWFDINGYPVKDDLGRIQEVVFISADVTDRETALASLRESDHRFRQLADSMPQIVWTANPDGYFDYYNRRWYEYTGLPENVGGDASWEPILHPDDVPRCRDIWYASVETGRPYEIQYRFWDRRTNQFRWHLGRALPVSEKDGTIVKWFGTCTDIDDHKRLLEELEDRVAQRTSALTESLSEKEILLKEVHHRVKNNLQVICSLLSMQMASDDPYVGGSLRVAYNRVQSMALVHEKLYQSSTLSDIDFSEYIEMLGAHLFQAYCVDTGRIRLELDTHPVRLTLDEAIPCGLIVNELLSNSLKHAFVEGRDGFIRIQFHQTETGRVHLTIADNGAGFPKDLKLGSQRSLGMHIVETLAHQLGGDLSIDCKGGATVTIDWQKAQS